MTSEKKSQFREFKTDNYSGFIRFFTNLIKEKVNAERVTVWNLSTNNDSLVNVCLSESAHSTFNVKTELKKKDFPSYFNAILQGRPIDTCNPKDGDTLDELELIYKTPRSEFVILDIPILLNGNVVGVFSTMRKGNILKWPLDEASLFSLAADILSHFFDPTEKRILGLGDVTGSTFLLEALNLIEPGFVVFDDKHRLIFSNKAYEKIYPNQRMGSKFEDLLNIVIDRFDVGSREDKKKWKRERLKKFLSNESFYEHRLSNGTWLQVHERRLPNNWSIGTRTDITKLKNLVHELSQKNETLSTIFNDEFVGILTCLEDGAIQTINESACSLFGYKQSEILAKQRLPELIKTNCNSDIFLMGLSELKKTNINPFTDLFTGFEGRRRSGTTFPIEVSVSYSEALDIFTVFILDKTEQTRAEKAADRARKMYAVGMLAGGISHDFNNIIAVARGNLELAQRFLPEGDEASQYLEQGIKSLEKASNLTGKLLSLSEDAYGDESNVDINDCIDQTLELIKPIAEQNIKIKVSLDRSKCLVNIDKHEFADTLINLCINSMQAMPKGGTISIETAHSSPANTTKNEEAKQVSIFVSDSGEGIPKDIIENIFDPYFTTKKKEKGTGLGLSMVYSFVQKSGGTIEVESSEGEGATFILNLPLTSSE